MMFLITFILNNIQIFICKFFYDLFYLYCFKYYLINNLKCVLFILLLWIVIYILLLF